MNITWLVTQGRTYDIERKGGYIWAPKHTKEGAEKFFWNNLTRVTPGDIIIHYSTGIKAVSRVTEPCQESVMPQELAKADELNTEGWMVKCEYFDLGQVIRIIKFKDEILKYCTEENSAFNSKGSVKQGYLFELNEIIAVLFMREILKVKPDLSKLPFINEFLNKEYAEDSPVNEILNSKNDRGNEVMTNQMLSNLERLMALHESTQLVKRPSRIALPELITKKSKQAEAEDITISKETVKELADTKLRQFLEEGAIDEDEVYDMRFIDYSEETFGIDHPLLLRARALTFDDSPNYFRKQVIIRDEKFYLCSNWSEKQRVKLEKWLNAVDARVNAIPEYKDIKIRDLAKGVLRDMLMAGKASPEEVEKMFTLDYSSETFGINYPLLVKERNQSNAPNYFKVKVPIRGQTLFLCSQWFEQPKNNDRPLLEKWIKAHR